MRKNRKIYSLNLIAYISMNTNLEPQLFQDEKGLFYAVFPEIRSVAYAIRDFKKGTCKVNIHDYLLAYKHLRMNINAIRQGG